MNATTSATTTARTIQTSVLMQGEYLRARLLRPVTLVIPAAIFVFALLGGSTVVDAALAALIALAIVAAVLLRRALRDAREAFFVSYASSRGLEQRPERALPEVAPLLRIGESRFAERVMAGVLPGGLEGLLGLYTYEEGGGEDAGGHDRHRFTVALHWLPDVTGNVLELYCAPSSEAAGIVGFRRKHRLQLESVALDSRFEIFFGPDDDERRLRRIYSPSFIVWLSEQTPPDFGFQLSNGNLCAFAPGHLSTEAELDALCHGAAAVGRRLLEAASG